MDAAGPETRGFGDLEKVVDGFKGLISVSKLLDTFTTNSKQKALFDDIERAARDLIKEIEPHSSPKTMGQRTSAGTGIRDSASDLEKLASEISPLYNNALKVSKEEVNYCTGIIDAMINQRANKIDKNKLLELARRMQSVKDAFRPFLNKFLLLKECLEKLKNESVAELNSKKKAILSMEKNLEDLKRTKRSSNEQELRVKMEFLLKQRNEIFGFLKAVTSLAKAASAVGFVAGAVLAIGGFFTFNPLAVLGGLGLMATGAGGVALATVSEELIKIVEKFISDFSQDILNLHEWVVQAEAALETSISEMEEKLNKAMHEMENLKTTTQQLEKLTGDTEKSLNITEEMVAAFQTVMEGVQEEMENRETKERLRAVEQEAREKDEEIARLREMVQQMQSGQGQ